MFDKKQQSMFQPITGTFQCPVCGGSTSIVNETNPAPMCHYCGAPLPELKRKLDEQFAFIQEQYRSSETRNQMQMEFKQQQELLKQKSAEDRKAARLENQQRTREAKIRHQTEVQRMKKVNAELERRHREELMKRQEQLIKQQKEAEKENRKSMVILLLILFGALFAFIFMGSKILSK